MTIDILDQPRGEILEKTVEYFALYPEPVLLDDLIRIMTYEDADKFFLKNVLELLKELEFIEIKNKTVFCNLENTVRKFSSSDFSINFKLSLLNKVSESKEPKIKYFIDILRLLMEKRIVSEESLEEVIREARVKNKIKVSSGEEGSGKKQFLKQLLSYYNILIPYEKSRYLVTLPDTLFYYVLKTAINDLDKKNVNLVLDLLPHIDSHYFPVFDMKKENPLPIILSSLRDQEKTGVYRFSFVGDGGAGVEIGDNKVNYIEEVGE